MQLVGERKRTVECESREEKVFDLWHCLWLLAQTIKDMFSLANVPQVGFFPSKSGPKMLQLLIASPRPRNTARKSGLKSEFNFKFGPPRNFWPQIARQAETYNNLPAK